LVFFDEVDDTVEGELTEELCGLWLTSGSNKLWSIFGDSKIYTLIDTLVIKPTLTAPADGSSSGRTSSVTLQWEAVPDADEYQIYASTLPWFGGVTVLESEWGTSTEDTSYTVQLSDEHRGITVYWLVRVKAQEPYRSLWSNQWTLTTQLVGSQWNPFRTAEGYAGGVAPMPGAEVPCGVVAFQWNAADWATAYELVLALNDTFTSPVASVKVPNPAWVSDVELKCETIYFWRVRAVSDNSQSEWGVGSFLTKGLPAPPAPPAAPPVVNVPPQAPPQVTVPSPIPMAAIWAIVIIGAVLVIAVIVLILVTRRAPR
jgi:hypothetical protein